MNRGPTDHFILLASIICPHLLVAFKKRSRFHSPVRISTRAFVTIGKFETGNGELAVFRARSVARLRPLHRPRMRRSSRRRARKRIRGLSPSTNGDRASIVSRLAKRVGLFSRWKVS